MVLVSGWLLALYRHKDILVNSSLKATNKLARAISKKSGERSRAILALLFVSSVIFTKIYNEVRLLHY